MKVCVRVLMAVTSTVAIFHGCLVLRILELNIRKVLIIFDDTWVPLGCSALGYKIKSIGDNVAAFVRVSQQLLFQDGFAWGKIPSN